MVSMTHSQIEPAGYSNMWECYIYTSDHRYYTELGWPCYGGRNKHHAIVFARNARSAKKKIDRLIKKVEKKYNY